MMTLAHIKGQSRLSLGNYGRPRMAEKLKEIGLNVGHRRVGRLMRQTSISVVRTRKHKVTTDSDHKFNIVPNLLDRNLNADQPNRKWAGDMTCIWTREGWRPTWVQGIDGWQRGSDNAAVETFLNHQGRADLAGHPGSPQAG